MAYLTKTQIKQIVERAPSGTTPEGVISALRAEGHQLEGYPTAQQESTIQNNVATGEKRKNVLQKAGDFLGISKFGEGIGRTINNVTGGLKPIEEAMTNMQTQQSKILEQYKIARDKGDKAKAEKYLGLASELGTSMQDLAKTYGEVGTGNLTNKEILGSAALTAGNILLAGAGTQGTAVRGSIGANVGSKVTSVLPALAKPLVRNAGVKAYLTSLGANVAKSAAVGGGMSALGALEDNQDTEGVLRATGIGLLVGGAIPPALEVGRAALKGVQATTKLIAQTFAKTPAKAIEYAQANPEGVRAGIRRAISDEKTVFKVANTANKAASNIELKRNAEFAKGIKKLETQLKGQPIDPTPFNERLKASLERFSVITKNGKLNPESIISDPRELKDVQTVLNRMKDQKNLTPEGWWNLKRFVANKYRPTASNEFNALITDMTDGLREEMIKNVKGFDKVLAGYEADSTLLTFLKKELGVSGRARGLEIGGDESILIQDNTKRVINALRRAMSDNQPLANELVKELERVGGKEVMDDLAGMYFANWLPPAGLQSLLGLGAGGVVTAAAGIGTAAKALPLAAFASPRIVGESAALTGQITRGLRNINPQLLEALKTGTRGTLYGGVTQNLSK